MAFSYNSFGPKGPGDTITVDFEYEDRSDISVLVDGAVVDDSLWEWVNDGLILCKAGFPPGTSGMVQRDTDISRLTGRLVGTAVLDYPTINGNFDRLLFRLQENDDGEASREARVVAIEDTLEEQADALAASVELGRRWAEEEEDVAVVPGHYSALHHSQKSQEAAALAEGHAGTAEGWAEAAEGYAAIALKNWKVDTFVGDGTDDPLILTSSPGSALNCIVIVEGEGPQPRHIFSVVGNALHPPSGSVWPLGKGIEVSYGTSFESGTPSDGSVTSPKLGTEAVTEIKIAPGAVTESKLGVGSVSQVALQDEAVVADKLSADPLELAAMALKLGIQPRKLLNISLVRDVATYSTTAMLGINGNVNRSCGVNSPTSSLLVLSFLRLEMVRDGTVGTTGMVVDLRHFDGSTYVSHNELYETLDTDGPASHITRQGAALAIVLDASKRRSDAPDQWSVMNYFGSANSACTAKIIRQTFVFIEFEP